MAHGCSDWRRGYSESLGQGYVYRRLPGGGAAVRMDDGCTYSPEEIALLQRAGGSMEKSAHEIKRAFAGILSDVERLPEVAGHHANY